MLTDDETLIAALIQLKNIVLIIATCLSVYYISGWMIFMMCFATTVNGNKKSRPDQ